MTVHNEALAPAKQARGITGINAAVFVGIMILAYIAGAVTMSNSEASMHLFKASLFLAAAAWAISYVFPAGWFNLKRTLLIAVVLYGGLLGFVIVGASR